MESVEALISLCADLDEANLLLDRGTDISIASSVSLDRPRMAATWLAPKPNQEMSARELLRVKVLWPTCGQPNATQVWSIFEFARWLEALRGPELAWLADDGTPRKPETNRSGDRNRSSSIGCVSPAPAYAFSPTKSMASQRSPTPTPLSKAAVQRSPTPCRARHSEPLIARSTSPAPVPRPLPSPTPMPRGLDSTKSLADSIADANPQRAASSSFGSPIPYTGRHSAPYALQTTPKSDRRPQSADPCRDSRMVARERAAR